MSVRASVKPIHFWDEDNPQYIFNLITDTVLTWFKTLFSDVAAVSVGMGGDFTASASMFAVPDEAGIIANGLGDNISESEPSKSISALFDVPGAAVGIKRNK